MAIIKKRPEDIKYLTEAYLQDTTLKFLFNAMAEIYMKAVPKGLVSRNGEVEIFYDDKTWIDLRMLKEEIRNHTMRFYKDLFDVEVPDPVSYDREIYNDVKIIEDDIQG